MPDGDLIFAFTIEVRLPRPVYRGSRRYRQEWHAPPANGWGGGDKRSRDTSIHLQRLPPPEFTLTRLSEQPVDVKQQNPTAIVSPAVKKALRSDLISNHATKTLMYMTDPDHPDSPLITKQPL